MSVCISQELNPEPLSPIIFPMDDLPFFSYVDLFGFCLQNILVSSKAPCSPCFQFEVFPIQVFGTSSMFLQVLKRECGLSTTVPNNA